METHHSKIHYKWQFSIAMLVYQRVNMFHMLKCYVKTCLINQQCGVVKHDNPIIE